MVLLELFAHLTETMLYRLNRLPEKAYVEFLRLHRRAAAAARGRERAAALQPHARRPSGRVEIPRGTRRHGRAQPRAAASPCLPHRRSAVRIPAGERDVDVLAYHCEQVSAELAGGHRAARPLGDGAAAAHRRADGRELDLMVGVEAAPARAGRARAGASSTKAKPTASGARWTTSANLAADSRVYMADRMTGTITFAPAARLTTDGGRLAEPAALAAVPDAGREIRLWYRRGGGPRATSPPAR